MKMIFFFLLTSLVADANVKSLGIKYFIPFMGHIHETAGDHAPSLGTIQCSQALNLIMDPKVKVPMGWSYVRIGKDKGFVRTDFLGKKNQDCFQSKYSKFYLNMRLDLSEYYYWGRLLDHYLVMETRPK